MGRVTRAWIPPHDLPFLSQSKFDDFPIFRFQSFKMGRLPARITELFMPVRT